jgi:phage virion morphogenesis protein
MLTITFNFEDVQRQLGKLADKIKDRRAVHQIIGEVLLDKHRERFLDQVSPDGDKWPALSPVTLANRRSPKGILRDSGELFRSIHMKASSESAQVGTNLNHPKVFVHQYGATIKLKSAKALVIPGGKGANRPIFAKSVTIKPRPYIGVGDGDEKEVMEVLLDYLEN